MKTLTEMAAWLAVNTSRAERRKVELGDDSGLLWLACEQFPNLTIDGRETVVLAAEQMIVKGNTIP